MKVLIRNALIYWVYIPAAVILCGKGADLLFKVPPLPDHRFFTVLGILLLIAGNGFIFKAMRDLAVYGNGTPGSEKPPKKLVTRGSYDLCRHPMFFGYNLGALGVIFLFRSLGIFFISFPVFILFEVRFLKKEETTLKKRFDPAFEKYRKSTPFIIPGLKLRRRNE